MSKPLVPSSNPGFVHLHVHSAYSLLKGSIKIARLGELAKADRQPALALTDTDNMFGALEFSDKMAGYGIQPIVGCEIAVDFGDQTSAGNAQQCVVGFIIVRRGKIRLVGCNQRQTLGVGKVNQRGLDPPLLFDAMPLYLDIKAVTEQASESVAARGCECGLIGR